MLIGECYFGTHARSGSHVAPCRVVVANNFVAFVMVSWGICIYVLKQSLFHRPSCCMSQRGNPAAAAVVAAPSLSEWLDTVCFGKCGNAIFSKSLHLFLVKYVPSANRNNGPFFVG